MFFSLEVTLTIKTLFALDDVVKDTVNDETLPLDAVEFTNIGWANEIPKIKAKKIINMCLNFEVIKLQLLSGCFSIA